MNNIQIEQFNERLKKLGEFAKRADGRYSESEIIDWVSECVGVFYEIERPTFESQWPQLKQPWHTIDRKINWDNIIQGV